MHGSSNSKRQSDPRRQRAERHGHWAEAMAIAALSLKGYRLLARRFKTPHGEIDLIMRRGRATIFVEVKQRGDLDAALISVSPAQMRRISAASRFWVARDPRALQGDCRFDIVGVSPYRWPRHITNAFEARE
ncbi:MAG: YraN family protein [Hyphomicrobiales bacterium]